MPAMGSDEASNSGSDVQSDYLRMYYEHPYDRISILEQHGFTISNLVIGICFLAPAALLLS